MCGKIMNVVKTKSINVRRMPPSMLKKDTIELKVSLYTLIDEWGILFFDGKL